MTRIKGIREKEKQYHEKFYQSNNLFERNTWLEKPVKTVIESFSLLDNEEKLSVLDLGCGVGRNAIPIAKQFKNRNSRLIGIDILQVAIDKLIENSKIYDVDEHIVPVVSSIEEYDYNSDKYDFVFSVSSLEHMASIKDLKRVLNNLKEMTNKEGVHCFIINTSVKEVNKKTKESLYPQFEVNIDSNDMFDLLDGLYSNWKVIKRNDILHQFEIIRDGKPVILTTTVVTFVAQNNL